MADAGTLPAGWQASAFAQLADASRDGVWACDRELRCLYWNAAMERLSRLPAAQALGHSIVDILAGLGEVDAAPAIRRALAGAGDARSAGDGADPPRWQTRHFPIQLGSGEIVGVGGVVRDVTEEERIRQELGETDARFRNMADASPVLLWMSRTDGLCTFFNQTWLEFTGRTMAEEWGVGWAENVYFEDLEACLATYVAAFNERRRFEMEYRLRRKDGAYRWILDRGAPRYAPDGSFVGYIGSCVDITEWRSLEAELRGAIEARDDFLSVASHELGTPLTALKLNVEQLARVLRSNALGSGRTIEDRVSTISGEVQRLTNLVETLLDTTRIAAGGVRLNLDRLDLGQVVEQVLSHLAPVSQASRCAVTFLPKPALVGMWDRGRLEQALTNVVGNALKFGAGEPVEVTLEGDDRNAVARVRDHGVGLPATEHALIFERFGRAPHTRNYGGLGLGLWIARQSVEAMGGTIRVQSHPGQGATFEIVLPRSA
ncbi:MAG TPA: ATP-binding protein [Polyangia bacterium]|nr:ATP-binding protein [Polyangia bacterium]